LGYNIIHSATNPIPTLMEHPFDAERAVRRFEEANRLVGT
jgi:hypothetical protein